SWPRRRRARRRRRGRYGWRRDRRTPAVTVVATGTRRRMIRTLHQLADSLVGGPDHAPLLFYRHARGRPGRRGRRPANGPTLAAVPRLGDRRRPARPSVARRGLALVAL